MLEHYHGDRENSFKDFRNHLSLQSFRTLVYLLTTLVTVNRQHLDQAVCLIVEGSPGAVIHGRKILRTFSAILLDSQCWNLVGKLDVLQNVRPADPIDSLTLILESLKNCSLCLHDICPIFVLSMVI